MDEAYCGALCQRYDEACAPVSSTCKSRCVDDNQHLARMRPVASDAIAGCVNGDSCDNLENGSGHCFQEAADTLDATAAQKEFCSSYVARAFECRGYATVDECTDWFALWDDAAMSSLDECLAEPCDGMSDCIDAQLRGTP